MTPEWQARLHSAIVDSEGVGTYIVKGLQALQSNPGVMDFVKGIPALARFAGPLLGMIPVVGEVESVLEVADWGVEHWEAIAALGAAVHFAPADGDDLARLQSAKGQDL